MKIIVIGAAGFLGNVLCRLLLKNGYAVTAADLNISSARSLFDLNINKLDLDIRDSKALEMVIQGQDIVYHLASVVRITQDRDKIMHDVNVNGVRKVAGAALQAGVSKFFFVSSIHAFSRFPSEEVITENRELALSSNNFDYDRTKALGELALQEFIKKGLRAIILNPTCFIGPYDFQPSLMGMAIRDFFSKKIIPYIGGGFNFVDVRDVAQTLIYSMDKAVPGESYILGGEWISVSEMVDLIVKIRNKSALKIKLPEMVAHLAAQVNLLKWRITQKEPAYSNQSLSHLKYHRYLDDSKARKILNHQSRPLNESLKDIFNWQMPGLSGDSY